MSLTDLKKKVGHKPNKPVSVDEFIEGATAYAKGLTADAQKKTSNRNFKNATFTLTPDNILQLQELADHSGQAKSKIIRGLIDYLHRQPEQLSKIIATDE